MTGTTSSPEDSASCLLCDGPVDPDAEEQRVCEDCIIEQEQLIDDEVEDVYNRFPDQRGDA